VNAVPGGGPLQLEAAEGGITQNVGGRAAFGDIGGYADVPAGKVQFEVRSGEGSAPTASERLRNRAHYTVVAVQDGLRVLHDGRAQPGQARLRVVHAAPELGAVDVRLGDSPVADGADFGDVSGYTAVEPGAYAVRVTNPNNGSALAARGAVPLTAGTSSTAFVLGSGGEPLQVAVADERTAAPRGAPATGLGGLAGEEPRLVLALAAGLLAALAGAAAYLTLTGRSRRGDS
jgi:hypothetical protein